MITTHFIGLGADPLMIGDKVATSGLLPRLAPGRCRNGRSEKKASMERVSGVSRMDTLMVVAETTPAGAGELPGGHFGYMKLAYLLWRARAEIDGCYSIIRMQTISTNIFLLPVSSFPMLCMRGCLPFIDSLAGSLSNLQPKQ